MQLLQKASFGERKDHYLGTLELRASTSQGSYYGSEH